MSFWMTLARIVCTPQFLTSLVGSHARDSWAECRDKQSIDIEPRGGFFLTFLFIALRRLRRFPGLGLHFALGVRVMRIESETSPVMKGAAISPVQNVLHR